MSRGSRRQYERLQATSVLELRIHGVAGTPPENMLGVGAGDTVKVAGDRLTGFHRCAAGTSPYGRPRPGHVAVEAYSWGQLTAGAAGLVSWLRRAAWLTLLPLALGNLAYWTRPAMATAGHARTWGAILMRLANLLLTLTLVASAFTVGVDMIAWQCHRGAVLVCRAIPGLGLLTSETFAEPGRRVLVGSLLPVGVLVALWALSLQSSRRYEAVKSTLSERLAGSDDAILRRSRMWRGEPRVAKLRRLHVAAGIAYIVILGSWTFALPQTDFALLAGGGLLLLVACALLTAATYQDGLDFPECPDKFGNATRWVLGLACALFVAFAVVLWFVGTPDAVNASLVTGHNAGIGLPLLLLVVIVAGLVMNTVRWWLAPLIVVGLLLVVGLAWRSHHAGGDQGAWAAGGLAVGIVVAGFLARATVRGPARAAQAWRGAAPAMVLGAAVWIAALFTTAMIAGVGNYLNGPDNAVSSLQADYVSAVSPGARVLAIEQAGTAALLAVGEVTVTDAEITTDGQDVAVSGGRITAERLFVLDDEGVQEAIPGADLAGGTVRVQWPVSVTDSCHRTAEAACETVTGSLLQPPNADVGEITLNGSEASVRVSSLAGVQEPLVVPEIVIWFCFVFPAWLLFVALAAGMWWIVWRSNDGAVSEQVTRDGVPAAQSAASLRARMTAGFTHRAERLLRSIALLTCIATVSILLGTATATAPSTDFAQLRWLIDAGLWVALGVSAAIVGLAAKMRSSDGIRRSVGVLWDLTTFWPRVAGPLGPPCYAERVVPEVVDRVVWARRNGAEVIISAHSQGSVIAVAALSQLAAANPRDTFQDVRVITYGSQLRMWYGRVFSAVFSADVVGYAGHTVPISFGSAAPDALDLGSATVPAAFEPAAGSLSRLFEVAGPSPRWVNLYRRTDPIGFRVFTDRQSRADRYVSEYSPGAINDVAGVLNTHSRYQFSTVYEKVVRTWYLPDRPVSEGDPVLHPAALLPP